ncbi:hypothetical protein [Streptomyces sp. NPDC060184]|uniref:hypothetical protein n=1 Tax=Streptomyces sp. NPDC060184 TaxID=3347064 RepID=UPI00364E948F
MTGDPGRLRDSLARTGADALLALGVGASDAAQRPGPGASAVGRASVAAGPATEILPDLWFVPLVRGVRTS